MIQKKKPSWSDRRNHHKMRLATAIGNENADMPAIVRTAKAGGVTVSEIHSITDIPVTEIETMIRTGPGGREDRQMAQRGSILDKRYPVKGRKIA